MLSDAGIHAAVDAGHEAGVRSSVNESAQNDDNDAGQTLVDVSVDDDERSTSTTDSGLVGDIHPSDAGEADANLDFGQADIDVGLHDAGFIDAGVDIAVVDAGVGEIDSGVCYSASCDDAVGLCGVIDDGCGDELNCGECDEDFICGLFVANRCGQQCDHCPPGFGCDEQGACVGGDPTNLVIDIPHFEHASVNGTLSINGMVPEAIDGSTTECVNLELVHESNSMLRRIGKACAADDWTYSIDVAAGNYQFLVHSGGSSILPDGTYVAVESLAIVDETLFDINLELSTELVKISGTISVNGQPPVVSEGVDDGCFSVVVRYTTGYSSVNSGYACASSGWTYEVQVWQGSYNVYTAPVWGLDAPSVSTTLATDLEVSSDAVVDVDVEVPEGIEIGGVLSVNGSAPSSDQCVTAVFTHLELGFDSYVDICPSNGWQYSLNTWVGTFNVGTVGVPGFSQWGLRFTAAEDLVLDQSATVDIDVDAPEAATVSGVVHVDGQVPTILTANGFQNCVILRATQLELDVTTDFYACKDAYAFSHSMLSGMNRIEIVQHTAYFDMPVSLAPIFVDVHPGQNDDVVIDFELPAQIEVQGTVSIHGQPPIAIHDDEEMHCVRLGFNRLGPVGEEPMGEEYDAIAYACQADDWVYSATLWAGKFRVDLEKGINVMGGGGDMPVLDEIELPTSMTLDVDAQPPPMILVSGVILSSGTPPQALDGEDNGCVKVHFGGPYDSWHLVQRCVSTGFEFSAVMWSGAHTIEYSSPSNLNISLPSGGSSYSYRLYDEVVLE